MLSEKDQTTKDLVRFLFEITHDRNFTEHAIRSIRDENHAEHILSFLRENDNLSWQDIEYEILISRRKE